MKLYYLPGACSMAAHIVLNTIEEDFEIERVDVEKQLTESGIDYTTLNAKGYVPLLQLNDGNRLSENTAILSYLGQLKPEFQLVPDDTILYFKVQEALSFISSELHKAFSPFFSSDDLTDEEEQQAHGILDKKLEYLNQQLADGRDYLHGNQPFVSDYYLFVVANWANMLGFGLDKWPHIKNHVDRFLQMPAVIKSLQSEGIADQVA